MNTRHLITGGLLATCLLSSKADPFSTTLFYTRYGTDSNPYNVKKVDISYDGTSWTVGSPVNVGITPGADGIVGDPQNANLVLVGGQGPTVSTVDKNTGFVNTYSSPNVTFHLAVPTPNTLLGSGIPGQLGRVPIIETCMIGCHHGQSSACV